MSVVKRVMWLSMYFIGTAQSQEHVHGNGSIFIVQQGADWQVQFVLPASDALGFEHKPENQQQRDTLNEVQGTFVDINNLMRFDAKCMQKSYSDNLSEFNAEDAHFEQEDEHEKHHPNIEVSYAIQCSGDITSLSFPIFRKMHSLQKLDVQWSVNKGQGSAVIKNDGAELELK
jgi:hypothetical protein